jgi:chromosomal replication initiator protein
MRDLFSDSDVIPSGAIDSAWQNVQQRLSSELQSAWFTRYIQPLRPIAWESNRLRLAAPGKFVQSWVCEHLFEQLKIAFEDELGHEIELDVVAEAREREVRHEPSPVIPNAVVTRAGFQPNPRFTFATFIVGDSNRLAFAGANAVADLPGDKYNPLFIYGASGLGKTHLLHAIANELKQRRPNLEVEYVTAQQFAEDFVRALQSNRMEQFRRAHRNSGVWLVDDIQFIAGKDKTQEEVYHTFNALQQFGKQIVFTSDRLPKDLYGMDERLRSRFESGLVADVEMPNTETRCAIIRSKAEQDGIDLPFDVAFQLALNVPGNIRVLEGALTRLVATASLNQTPLSMEFTNEFVEKYYRTRQSRPSVSQIIEAVSKHYDIPASDIKGNSRKAPITLARHVAIFMTRRITQDSWNHIGSLFGDRDHTSVMHGYQRIDTMMQTNKDFAAIVNQLIRDVHPEC